MAGFLTYLSKRLGLMGITLGLVTIITFGFTNVLPGDVALLILGPNADPASVDALRTQLGLDQPLYVQYGQWISQMAGGSFGDSLRYGDPVMTLIMERLPRSLMLAGAATIVAVGLAIPLGVIAAINENRWPDFAASVFAFAGISVPGFLWGIFFIYVFGVYFGVLPTGGYVSPREDLIASIKHLTDACRSTRVCTDCVHHAHDPLKYG